MPLKIRKILLPVIVVLFLLEVMTFPLVLSLTYASGSETPEHILTFADRKLTWDMRTDTDKNGAAILSLFDVIDSNVSSDNGESVVAPGMDGKNIIRLKNEDDITMNYTAIVYSIRSDERLPVTVQLSGEGFSPAYSYNLPDDLSVDNVISAVCGTVESGQIQDFGINWVWQYEENAQQDIVDTAFGDSAAFETAERIKAGIVIIAEGENGDIAVSAPQTGHYGILSGYLLLMLISIALLLFLALTKPKEKYEEK